MVRLCLHVHVSIQACAHPHTLKKANKYPKRAFAMTSRAEEGEARLKDAMANMGESCEGDTRVLQGSSAPVRLTEASVLRAKLTLVFAIGDVGEQAPMDGGFLMDWLK